jgi:hypothetical protein
MAMSCDQTKERYKVQILHYVNNGQLTSIATCIQCCLSPGHTAHYGLITAKARQNIISREADKIKQIKQNNLFDYFYLLFLIPTLNKNYLI